MFLGTGHTGSHQHSHHGTTLLFPSCLSCLQVTAVSLLDMAPTHLHLEWKYLTFQVGQSEDFQSSRHTLLAQTDWLNLRMTNQSSLFALISGRHPLITISFLATICHRVFFSGDTQNSLHHGPGWTCFSIRVWIRWSPESPSRPYSLWFPSLSSCPNSWFSRSALQFFLVHFAEVQVASIFSFLLIWKRDNSSPKLSGLARAVKALFSSTPLKSVQNLNGTQVF